MSNPGSAVAEWQKANTCIWLETDITTDITDNPDYAFRNIEMGPWPKRGREVVNSPHHTNAYPMKVAGTQRRGVARPVLNLRLPLTPSSLGFAIVSVCQAGVETGDNIGVVPYTGPIASKFFNIQAGIAQTGGYTVRTGIGFVARRVTLRFPAVGTSGGEPELEIEAIGRDVDAWGDDDAFSGTAPSVDAAVVPFTTGLSVTGLKSGASKFISMNMVIENGAAWSENVGDKADGIGLDEIKITGDVTVHQGLAVDEYGVMQIASDASTLKALVWSLINPAAADVLGLTHSVKWGEPGDPAKQGVLGAVTFPFETFMVDPATSPKFTVYGIGGAGEPLDAGGWVADDDV